MNVKRGNLNRFLLLVIAVFILIYPFIFKTAFYQHIMIMVFMYGLLAISWDLMGGYARLFSFGHSAFFGIGAYTSTVMLIRWGINPWIGMIIGGCLSGIVGVSISGWGVRLMKTKWGSCNTEKKTILLNLELAKKPIICLEFIVVHELVHLLERLHNDNFIYYMDLFLPQWRKYRDELNSLPNLLPSKEQCPEVSLYHKVPML